MTQEEVDQLGDNLNQRLCTLLDLPNCGNGEQTGSRVTPSNHQTQCHQTSTVTTSAPHPTLRLQQPLVVPSSCSGASHPGQAAAPNPGTILASNGSGGGAHGGGG